MHVRLSNMCGVRLGIRRMHVFHSFHQVPVYAAVRGFDYAASKTRGFNTSSHTQAVSEPPTMSSDNVLVQVSDGVRKITINRPEKKNAMTPEMFKGLLVGLREANTDDNTVIVALTGTGEYFTSGMDLTPRPKPPPTEAQQEPPKPRKKGEMVAKFLSGFIDCKKPLIALVNGPAFGAGVTILGHCDAVYASDRATFHTRFTQYGVPPEMASTYTFPRIMGYVKASNLLMFDQKMSAEEAFKNGLVSRIIPHSSFVQETNELVKTYAQLPSKSLMYTKELIRGGGMRDLMYKVSDTEQSYFDPEQARKVIMEFMMKKIANKQEHGD